MGEIAEYDADTLEALPIGTTIGGYTIRRIIGHGGFGITYEAHNAVTRKDAAIKEFFPSSLARRDGKSRLSYAKTNAETITWALRKFEETTTTLCGLKHANIVEVHDYVPANDTGYMIMELLDGQTLEHWLKARPQPPCLEELRPILDPVMEALGYVHGLGLIHRDIAPDNILITREGRPVLIDFGSVSRDLSDARRKAMSSTVGTSKRNYTAPEQSRAKARPTPEADIYSMGAVLYHALSGEKPVDGQDRVDAIFHEKGPDPYEPLMKRVPAGCTARAAQAIDTALAFQPDRRMHKIADLRAAMVPAAAAPVVAKTPKTWIAAAALAVVLAALGGVFAGSRWARDDNRAAQATLDGQRGELDRAKADVARERASVDAARRDIAKQRGDLDAAEAGIATDKAGIAKDKDDLAAGRAEVAAATTDIAKQRGDLETAKAETDRGRAELEQAKAEVARQRELLGVDKAGNDREDAAMRAAQADLDQQRKDVEQAKSDLARGNETLQSGQAQLAAQRDQLTADRRQLDQDKAQLGQGVHDEAGRLAKQLSDSQAQAERLATQLSDLQAQADDANRRRDAAVADAGRLRDQVQIAATEIESQRTELQEKTDEVARLTAEIERLRRPPARHDTSASSGSDPTVLQRRAREAAVIFYDKHGYSEGGNLDGLLALYPSGQKIMVNGTPRTGREQIAALMQYYNQRNYTAFDIRVEPESVDFAGCRTLDNCIVKGMTQSTYRTVDNVTPRGGTSNFCLRFDLRGSPKVLAEAATKPGKDASCE